MPPLTRWYVKSALLYFLVALLGGVWQAAGGPLWLMPITIHLLVVGWISGMIFGVAYWMFPRYSKERPRGPDGPALATFGLLQLGILTRLTGEPTAIRWLLVVSAVCQWLAAMGFIFTTWPRVRTR
jgi:hypothetical protein